MQGHRHFHNQDQKRGTQAKDLERSQLKTHRENEQHCGLATYNSNRAPNSHVIKSCIRYRMYLMMALTTDATKRTMIDLVQKKGYESRSTLVPTPKNQNRS
ncbi:hypothetical protein CLAIMM_05826 isoform 3 [Cladophialophora immunda]|nr:hypothetical protein CLAIMM_05826 isoform 3 [Cladophialophora immunda]